MVRSVSTSCRLYSINSAHFSGSSAGYTRLRAPDFCGTQNVRISALPAAILRLSAGRPIACPAPSRLAGYPQYSACSITSRHWSIGSATPSARDRQYHSNAALYACLMYAGSVSAARNSSGIGDSVKSTTWVSPSSMAYPISRISNAGDCAYLYSPPLAMSTSLYVSRSMWM